MGLIFRWARLASFMPGLVNFITQTPFLKDIAKAAAGLARTRNIPVFARQTFIQRFRRRTAGDPAKPGVILWPDTFNNYFYPETAIAAVEVLEAAGYQVRLPQQVLCCGRPLYDFGMLHLARQKLHEILHTLEADILAGVPIVGLEPSCIAVFRDELLNFFPDDPLARRLSEQTYSLSEFLIRKADYHPSKLEARAIVHGHCHDKAVIGMTEEAQLLDRLGLDYNLLDSGCCGMAGAFGFHKDHYALSIKIGEKVLLPAVRGAGTGTLIITDGFSCREQIAQTTPRRALHLAQVLQMALTRV
jgi:Fe-S oxidoreductase